MTRKIIILVLLVVSISSLNAYARLPDNFRGVKFGKPPAKHLKLADRDGPIDIYLDPHGVMAINNVKASAINYYYFKNKFYLVLVQGAAEDSGNLLKQLCLQFGSPREKAEDGSYLWLDGDFTAIFKPSIIEESTGQDTCGFILYQNSIRKTLDATQPFK